MFVELTPFVQKESDPSKLSNELDPPPLDNPDRDSFCGCETSPRCEHYPYRCHPGYSVWWLFAWMVLVYVSFGACLYGLASKNVMNGFSVPNKWGFNPSQNASFGSIGNITFTPADHVGTELDDPNDPASTLLIYALLFRTLPTQMAGMFSLGFMLQVDISMRFMQPFVSMFSSPATAADTILLGYLTASPLEVPLTALDNGHRKVAWFSTLATFSPLFPIFVGGLFTITSTRERVYFSFSLSAFIGCFTFLFIYCISLGFAWPQPHRRLPRHFHSLADLMAMCHQSRIFSSGYLSISDPEEKKAHLTREFKTKAHMNASILLRGDKYLFGQYRGRDNRWHLGFDIAWTLEDGRNRDVEFIPPGEESWWSKFEWEVLSRRGREYTRHVNSATLESSGGVFRKRRVFADRQEADRQHAVQQENSYEMHGVRGPSLDGSVGTSASASTGRHIRGSSQSSRVQHR